MACVNAQWTLSSVPALPDRPTLTARAATQLIREVDQDSGGSINYNEFSQKLKMQDAQTEPVFGREGMAQESRASSRAITVDDAKGLGAHGERSGAQLMDFIQQKVAQRSRNLRTEFRRFDEDSNGTVSRAEFRTGLLHLGVAVADWVGKTIQIIFCLAIKRIIRRLL